MKRPFALVTITALSVSACGKAPPNTDILDRSHDYYANLIETQLNKVQFPSVHETAMSLRAKTIEGQQAIPANIRIDMETTGRVDMRDPEAAKIDAGFSLDAVAEIPSVLLGVPPDSPDIPPTQTLAAKLKANFMVLKEKLFLKITDASVQAPMFPASIGLSSSLLNKWYGDTFETVNALMNTSATGETVRVQDIFTNQNVLNEQLKRNLITLARETRLWNAVEILPEKNGSYQVRVELDHKKFLAAGERFIDLIMRPSMESNTPKAQVDEVITAMKEEFRTSVNERLGRVTGVLAVDKGDYHVTGFTGEAEDKSDKSKTSIDYVNDDGRLALTITDVGTGAGMAFELQGENFALAIDGKPVLKGTANKERFTADVFEGEEIVALLELDFEEYGMEHTKGKGSLRLPQANIVLRITGFESKQSANFKDFSFHWNATAQYAGKDVAEIAIVSGRKEIEPFTMQEPSPSQPFQALIDGLKAMEQQLSGVAR